jgi:hypothetical protein
VRLLVSGALMAGLVLVAGCGEGAKPQDVARDYVATNKASKCDALDRALVEQLTAKRGDAALATCRENVVRFPAPRDVKVAQVKTSESGSEAERERAGEAGGEEAEVRLVIDGKEAEVRLRKLEGEWRIVALGE